MFLRWSLTQRISVSALLVSFTCMRLLSSVREHLVDPWFVPTITAALGYTPARPQVDPHLPWDVPPAGAANPTPEPASVLAPPRWVKVVVEMMWAALVLGMIVLLHRWHAILIE